MVIVFMVYGVGDIAAVCSVYIAVCSGQERRRGCLRVRSKAPGVCGRSVQISAHKSVKAATRDTGGAKAENLTYRCGI